MRPVLFVPGGIASVDEFAPGLADGLRADPGCEVIRHDRAGHGTSTDRGRFDTSADDLAAAIRTAGHGPALVVGQSLGGAAAVLLAATHPDTVAGLVLLDPTPIADVRACARIETTLRVLGTAARRQDPHDPRARLGDAARGLTRAARLVARSDLPTVPAAIVGADPGPSGAPNPAHAALATRLGTTVETWPGAPHDLQDTHPAEVLATVRAVLARC